MTRSVRRWRPGARFSALVDRRAEAGQQRPGALAACYLDSLATLNIPAIGYGIRYEFGIFTPEIRDGWQEEVADQWLRKGNPWEVPRPEIAYDIPFGGRTETFRDAAGRDRVRWIPDRLIRGVAYDTMITGYASPSVIMLRLFKAEATTSFDLRSFNVGDYYGAVHDKIGSENLTKVLYPNDEPAAGRRLRLMQQFLFVSCLQDISRIFLQRETDWRIPQNAISSTTHRDRVAELITAGGRLRNRLGGGLGDHAQTSATRTTPCSSRWRALFGSVLPRHLEIVCRDQPPLLDGIRRIIRAKRASSAAR